MRNTTAAMALLILASCANQNPFAGCNGNAACIEAVERERQAKRVAKEQERQAAIERDEKCVKTLLTQVCW